MSTNTAALLEKLHDIDPAIRRKAVRDLTSFPEKEVVEALAEALGDPNKGVQNSAIEALTQMRHTSVIEGLLPIIRGSDLNTRNAGMSILKSFGTMALPRLTEALNKAADVDEIIQILVVMGNIGSSLATDAILGFVGHDDDNVKTTAVEALGKIQDPKAIKSLINAYHQTDILKYALLEAMGNISVSDAKPLILNAIKSEDVLECFSGIGAMGAMEEPEFLQPLFLKLQSEEDLGTRRLIIKSMAMIEDAVPGSLAKHVDRTAIRPILNILLEQQNSAEFIYIVKVAAALKDEVYAGALLSAFDSSEAEIVDIAFAGLMALAEKGIRPALDRLGRVAPPVAIKILEYIEKFPHADIPKAVVAICQHAEDAVRQVIARTLTANPCEISFNALAKMLQAPDPDEMVRKNAVLGIRKMLQFDGSLSALINALKDANGHVRREAALALGTSSSKQVLEPLMNTLLKEPYGDVREAAAQVLAARKDAEITKKLCELLDSDNSRVRETIAKTIWQCGASGAVDSLIQKLSDKEWRVVVNACQSLEKMKDMKSIFPLKELLKHDDSQIRIAALSALRAFHSKELKQFLMPLIEDKNATVAKLAIEALSELEDKTLDEVFRKFLNHTAWEVRYQIVKALGKIKSQKAVDSLIQIAQTDPNNAVRAKALLALARINDKKAFDAAMKLLGHPDRDLIIAAIKFFLAFNPKETSSLEEKITAIFQANPWVKNYFLISYPENTCDLLNKVLTATATPRELRRIERLKEVKPTGQGMTIEETVLLREIVAEKCGIWLADGKALERKLSRDLSKFYINTWMEYYHALRYGGDEQNMTLSLYDIITDPSTGFFGEAEQNKVLVSTIIPEMIAERMKEGRREIRILAAGCSFGPEPYSLAMQILEDVHSDSVKISVVGVDISHICLNTAKRGIYKREMFRHVDQKYVDLYFEDDRGDLRIKDDVKNMVEFKFLNLSCGREMEAIGDFDIVVCRNVFSVFTQREKEKLAESLYNSLVPGGALFIAARESLYNVTKAFKLATYDKVVVYRKM
ncbi:MAG TPA: HEAT repeat domain-containing protein [Candidatus Ozemobacteraceae bacterium]|nr:HEAT repeat domain-containing protein [Candidatus Ozemobacteraceae bacterium]